MKAAHHISLLPVSRRKGSVPKRLSVSTVASNAFHRTCRSSVHAAPGLHILTHENITAPEGKPSLQGSTEHTRCLAHFIVLVWALGDAGFASASSSVQPSAGNDPWLRSLDLSIPESHDRRVGVYDVLKGVENTPSDNLLFAVARDILTTYELTKPFLEEVVRVHQQLRARQRENRKGNAEGIQTSNGPNGGITVQTVHTSAGKSRQRRAGGNSQAGGGSASSLKKTNAAGGGASSAVASISPHPAATESAGSEVGAAGLPAGASFTGGGGSKVLPQRPQESSHYQHRHSIRVPATASSLSRGVEAGKASATDSVGWWNAKKTKRSEERNAKKQGLSFQGETPGRGRRKNVREITREQLGEQGKVEGQAQNHQQRGSTLESSDAGPQNTTSAMHTHS